MKEVLPESGPVAQLGARFHGMEEVIGSIPIRSTKYFNHLEAPPFRDFVANSKNLAAYTRQILLSPFCHGFVFCAGSREVFRVWLP
jgi:hypothetical protein